MHEHLAEYMRSVWVDPTLTISQKELINKHLAKFAKTVDAASATAKSVWDKPFAEATAQDKPAKRKYKLKKRR
jgi:hypothetical protein